MATGDRHNVPANRRTALQMQGLVSPRDIRVQGRARAA